MYIGSNRIFPRIQDVGAVGGGYWSRTGTVVHLTTVTDTVAIGAAAMVGNEKVRIVGDLAFGAVPAGSGTIRFTDTNGIRWVSGGGTIYGLVSGQDTEAIVGGPYANRPVTVTLDAGTTTALKVAGNSQISITAGAVTYPSNPTVAMGTNVWTSLGALAFGAVPAGSGTIRFTDTNDIRWVSGGGTIYGLVSGQDTEAIVGGPYANRPVTVTLDAGTTTALKVAGNSQISITAGAVTYPSNPTVAMGTNVWTSLGALAFGAVPAGSGTIRFTDTNGIRWVSGGGSIYGLVSGQDTAAVVGGPYANRPVTIILDPSTGIAMGQYASAALVGQVASCFFRYTVNGDAQWSKLSLLGASTDATPVELTLTGAVPGAGTRLTISSGKCYRFLILLTVVCTAGTNAGQVATWELKGAIKNVSGTTTLVGAVVSDGSNSDLVGCTCVVTADDANDCLAVTFTGIAGAAPNTFHPHAAVYLSEAA